MGLKGNLAVVNLADVFQMLSRGKSSGLLRVQAPEGTRFIELQDGVISLMRFTAPPSTHIQLGDLLLSRKAINDENLGTAMKIHKENGMVLGQVLIEMNYVSRANLEESLLFLIEEEVCDLFTLREGEFDFLANASLDTKIAPGGGALRLRIEPDSLLLEAARRADEWHELEQRITSQSLLYRLTEDGQRVYMDADGISDEGRVIMRLLQANHTVEGIVQKSCLGRLNTNRMVLELWDAQLIEAVPKTEYLHYAKLQAEAGQIADAHRIAVHASKVGSPDTIKLAVPLIDTLRRQLAADDKPVVAQVVEKRASSATIKKVVNQNLILKKKPFPKWAKIAVPAVVLLALAGGAAFYFSSGVDDKKLADQKLNKLKADCDTKIRDRKFLDAINLAKNFTLTEPDLKPRHEKIKSDVQIDVDTLFIKDTNELAALARGGISRPDLVKYEKKLGDYEGVVFGNDIAIKAQKGLKRLIPAQWELIRTAEFKARLKELRENKQEWNNDQIVQKYREFLKEAPVEAEPIAKEARADLYKLLSPGIEAQRQLTLSRELLQKGGYDGARKIAEAVKSMNPGTPYSAEADTILKEIGDRETKSTEELSKIQKMILQRKTEEARLAAAQLIAAKPPAGVLAEVCSEMRKLQPDLDEKVLGEQLNNFIRIGDIDPKKSRAQILELVNANPFSETAAIATLSVQVVSSPDGATVTYKDKPLGTGKTPMVVQLPLMGPIQLTFSMPGFEPMDVVENNYRGESIPAVLVRKPQASVYAPIVASSGMLVLKELVLLAGGNEFNVCNARTLEVKQRINLESQPQTIKIGDKTEQPRALAKGELKLRGMSANTEDAEAYAFISCAGSYFFQIPTNVAGNEFQRIACSPGAVGEPEMYRPRIANTIKQISVITRSGIDVFSSERQFLANKPIPPSGPLEPPLGFAFDGDWYYVVCGENIYAVDGYRGDTKWKKTCDGRISLPPAVNPDTKLCAAVDVKGRVLIFNTELFGKDAGRSDLGVPCSLGLAASPTGFVAALDDNTIAFVPSSGGTPVWTVPLPGKALFTPQVRVAAEKRGGKSISAAIVCCDTGNGYMVVAVNLADGSMAWRGRLASKPIAEAVGPDAVFISTADSELVRFDFAMPGN